MKNCIIMGPCSVGIESFVNNQDDIENLPMKRKSKWDVFATVNIVSIFFFLFWTKLEKMEFKS